MGKQLTVVACHGAKRDGVSWSLVRRVQDMVADALGGAFAPHEEAQLHATIVGLEHRDPAGDALENRNWAEYRGARMRMDLDGLLAWLRTHAAFPMRIRIGGFADRSYGFTSRGETPYTRGFSFQGDKVVIMGWPMASDPAFPSTLERLRRDAQAFGVLHRYHRTPTDVDNDCYLRIGSIDLRAVSPGVLEAVARRVRDDMARAEPVVLEISVNDLVVAAYEDERFALATTTVWPLRDPRVDEAFLVTAAKAR